MNFVLFNNFVKLLENWGGGVKLEVDLSPSIAPLVFAHLQQPPTTPGGRGWFSRGGGGVQCG